MPTRIVLDTPREANPDSRGRRNKRRGLFAQSNDEEISKRSMLFFNSQHSNVGSLETPATPVGQRRKIVKFRSSIFRGNNPNERTPERQNINTGLSSTDIRASPRLIGYLYQLLASTVLLITVVKFYNSSQNETVLTIEFEKILSPDFRIINTIEGPVYFWKLVGCAIAGASGATLSLLIVLAHVDTLVLPRVWYTVFRDGSKYEQNLLRLILLFWVVSLHICTSALSVGQILGNVYFTSWIAFVAAAMNCGVWRVSAGYPSIAERISLHKRATVSFLLLFFFLCLFSGPTPNPRSDFFCLLISL